MGGIYEIFCEDNKRTYIGSAKDFDKRWNEHRLMLDAGKHHNRYLQNAWSKYGSSSFTFSILEEIADFNKEVFYQRENFWMQQRAKIFNLTFAGSGWNDRTFARRDEICKKISDTLKKTAANMTAEERKLLWGKGRKGKALTDEHKRKTSEGLRGKKKSEETRTRMSIAQRNAVNPLKREMMSSVGKSNVGRTPVNANVFEVQGVYYPSGAAVMKALGITSRQLHQMVLNGKARKEKKKL